MCIILPETNTTAPQVDHCHCTATNYEGPWCAYWLEAEDRYYCTLNGGMAAKDCPGAIKYKSHDEYWTSDAGVCNKSKSKYFSIAETIGSRKRFPQ